MHYGISVVLRRSRSPERGRPTVLDEGDAVQRFASALRSLFERAGSPTVTQLNLSPEARALVATFKDASVSDWKRGKSVPADARTLEALIRVLQARAAQRQVGYRPEPIAAWERRRKDARQQKRKGRPAAPTTAGRLHDSPGRPIAELDDPFVYDVHEAIEADVSPTGSALPLLPYYIFRDHDQELGAVIDRAAAGHNSAVFMVADSSTGKTRACWEAIGRHVTLTETWRLWNPISSGPPQALLEGLPHVAPRTVMWLDGAQQ